VYIKDSTFEGLKEIVSRKKQKAVANELDELIHEQEKRKKERERKTRNLNPILIDFFAKNPEKLKDISMDDIAKLSMLSSSENAKEYGKWLSVLRINNEEARLEALGKRLDFIEKLILKKL